MLSDEVVIQCSPRQREADNNNFVDNWWHKYTEHLWSLLRVAGDVPTPEDRWNETSHLSKTTETRAESEGYSQTYTHSLGTLQVVTPACENNPASTESRNSCKEQSQTAKEWNKEIYRTLASEFIEQGVRASYYDIRDAMGFTKTNKTVRAVYDEMTKLCGVYEDPSLLNARWVRDENYKNNVQHAIELLVWNHGNAYHYIPDGGMTFTYEKITSFIGAAKTNNKVRGIGAILEEKRTNPWDEDSQAYALHDFVYYLVPLRVMNSADLPF